MKNQMLVAVACSMGFFGVVLSSEKPPFQNPSVNFKLYQQQGQLKMETTYNKFLNSLDDFPVKTYCKKNQTFSCVKLVAIVASDFNNKKSFNYNNGLSNQLDVVGREMNYLIPENEKVNFLNKAQLFQFNETNQ